MDQITQSEKGFMGESAFKSQNMKVIKQKFVLIKKRTDHLNNPKKILC